MKTTKITKGLYITENNYLIAKTIKGWEVKNEVNGEIYATYKSKSQAINYTIY